VKSNNVSVEKITKSMKTFLKNKIKKINNKIIEFNFSVDEKHKIDFNYKEFYDFEDVEVDLIEYIKLLIELENRELYFVEKYFYLNNSNLKNNFSMFKFLRFLSEIRVCKSNRIHLVETLLCEHECIDEDVNIELLNLEKEECKIVNDYFEKNNSLSNEKHFMNKIKSIDIDSKTLNKIKEIKEKRFCIYEKLSKNTDSFCIKKRQYRDSFPVS
jgi:hypothetical protein